MILAMAFLETPSPSSKWTHDGGSAWSLRCALVMHLDFPSATMTVAIPRLLLAFCVPLVLLSGCGGVGSDEIADAVTAARLPPARDCGSGKTGAAAQACRGRLTLPGIDRIPLSRVSRTNAQMRRLWAATDHYSAINGSREHGRQVRSVSCWSYIVECDDPDDVSSLPFTYFQNYTLAGDYREIDYAEAGLARGDRNANAWFKRQLDDVGIRLVSVSVLPDGEGLVGQYGDGSDFLVLQSAGNERSDAFPVRADEPVFNGIRQAVAADKVVYVAGYTVDARSDIVRHPHSSGCDTVSHACVWVPFITPDIGRGTSFGAPRVAAALASVLAVFPDTTHQNLARLLKASAREVATLPNGLGVVDFTRLTTLDASGEWRLVRDGGEFNDAVAPLQLTHVTLPGDAAITSRFAISADGEAIAFATTLAGAFTRTALSPLTGSREGGNPIVAGKGEGLTLHLSRPNGDLYAGSVYNHSPSRLFASAGVGLRRDFFGLDRRHGYDRTIGYEANAGHRDLFIRVSRQTTWGKMNGLVRSADGAAVGFTARRSVPLSADTQFAAALHLDKFTGGTATTVFGAVRMAESGWNRTLAARLTHRPVPYVTLTAGVEVFSPARGDNAWVADLRLHVGLDPATFPFSPGGKRAVLRDE